MALLKIKDDQGNWQEQGNVGVFNNSRIVTILDHTFEQDTDWTENWGNAQNIIDGRHFWTKDVNGNSLKLDRLWIAINWAAGSDSACELVPSKTVCYIGKTPTLWYDGDEHSVSISKGSKANDIPQAGECVFFGYADLVTKWSSAVTSANPNYTTSSASYMSMYNFINMMSVQFWDCFKFYCTGTAKAGTRIRVWGESVN